MIGSVQHIGVADLVEGTRNSRVRCDLLLLFDKIALPGLRAHFWYLDITGENDELLANLKYLFDRGVLIDVSEEYLHEYSDPTWAQWTTISNEYLNLRDVWDKRQWDPDEPRVNAARKRAWILEQWLGCLSARYYATILNREVMTHAVPIIPSALGFCAYDRPIGGIRQEIVHLTIASVPLLREDIPYDELLAFKEDRDVAYHLSSFRRWVSDLSSSTMDVKRATQELEYLTLSYARFVETLGKSGRVATIGSFLVCAVEVVENLLKLRLTKAIEKVIEFTRTESELLKEEASAPGREVAFLLDVDKHFGSLKNPK